MTSMKIQLKWISNQRIAWFCLISAFLLVGCKSSISTTTSTTAIMKTEEAFFSSMLDRSFRFNTLSTRMNLDFSSSQQEFSSRVQLKMICDDRIQFSIQPFLGFELFRIELSNDSIKVIDKMNKRYMADNYQQLRNEMDIEISFKNVQALLTNQLFIPGESRISNQHYRQFRITKKNNQQAEFLLKGKRGTLYSFLADGDELLLSTKIENEPQKQQLIWEYSQFQPVDNQPFPMKMTGRFSSDDELQGTATLTFSTPVINNPLTMDFNIPSGYNRVTLEQMIHSLLSK